MTFGRFFLPGPTEVHPDILHALTQPMIPHRGQAMTRLLEEIANGMQRVFRTKRPVMIGTCSATGFMEMAVRSGVRHRVLSLVGGAFGGRFAAIASACGREVIKLEVPLGRTVESDMLRDALARTKVDAVTLVHSETSTGALAPVEDLIPVIREFGDIVILVDAVTSLGGIPVEPEAWDVDFLLTGSQKAMALPPGLAFAVASDRMIERAKKIPERGAYLDLLAFDEAARNLQPTNTPAIPLLYALAAQLERIEQSGGIAARWERHAEMLQLVEQWVEARGADLGLSYLPAPGRRSWTVSCIQTPEGVSGRSVAKKLEPLGFTIGSGYGPLKETTFRIGHMGDHVAAELPPLLEAIEQVMR